MSWRYGLMMLVTFVAALGLRLAVSGKSQEHSAEDASVLTGGEVSETIPFEIDPKVLFRLGPVERLVGLTRWSARASVAELRPWFEQGLDWNELEWRVLLIRWAELDELGFRAAAMALIEEDELFTEATVDWVLSEVARQMTLDRPKESLAMLEPDDPFIFEAYEAWLRQDRAAAMQAIDALPEGDQKEALFHSVAKVWASQEPRKALEWAFAQESGKDELIDAVFTQVISTDPDRAWAMLKEHGDRVIAGTKDEDGWIADSVSTLLWRAAKIDPGEALDWLGSVGDDDLRHRLIQQGASLSSKLKEASDWIHRLPFGKAREELAMYIIIQNASTLQERLEQVRALEDVDHDRLTGHMLMSSVFDFSQVSAAIDFWKDVPAEQRSSIVRSVVGLTFQQSPVDAVAWLEGLPAGVAEPEHYNRLWRSWTALDPESASSHLSAMEPGSHRDGAVAGLVESVALGKNVLVPDFESAWRWARSMGASEERETLSSKVEEAWRASDAESANKFFEDEG